MNAQQLKQLLDSAIASYNTVWTWDECFATECDIASADIPIESYRDMLLRKLDIMCARALREFGKPAWDE